MDFSNLSPFVDMVPFSAGGQNTSIPKPIYDYYTQQLQSGAMSPSEVKDGISQATNQFYNKYGVNYFSVNSGQQFNSAFNTISPEQFASFAQGQTQASAFAPGSPSKPSISSTPSTTTSPTQTSGGTSSGTSGGTSGGTSSQPTSGYINVQGSYFQNTPTGLQVVSDPKTLNQLKSGAIPSTQQSSLGSATMAGSTGSTSGATSTSSSTGISNAYDPSYARYVSQDQWNQLSPSQQAIVSSVLSVGNSMYASTGNKITLADALKVAATDPTIMAKYSDAFALDNQAFAQNIQALQTSLDTTAQQQKLQFEADRRALAEKQAAAGTAYSGFRGKAQQDLAQTEAGIVTSSQAQAKQSLQGLTSAFEAKYGSGATPSNTSISYANPLAGSVGISGQYATPTGELSSISSTSLGGITGSQPVAKQQEINTLAGQYVNMSQTPNVVQA